MCRSSSNPKNRCRAFGPGANVGTGGDCSRLHSVHHRNDLSGAWRSTHKVSKGTWISPMASLERTCERVRCGTTPREVGVSNVGVCRVMLFPDGRERRRVPLRGPKGVVTPSSSENRRPARAMAVSALIYEWFTVNDSSSARMEKEKGSYIRGAGYKSVWTEKKF